VGSGQFALGAFFGGTPPKTAPSAKSKQQSAVSSQQSAVSSQQSAVKTPSMHRETRVMSALGQLSKGFG